MSFFRRIKDRVAMGAKRVSVNDDSEAIFSLSSSYITLETKLGLAYTGRCALSIKAVSGGQFYKMRQDVEEFLDSVRSEFNLIYRTVTDSYGYLWIIFEGEKIEDLLAGLTAVGDTIQEKGFGEHILAAIFEFQSKRDYQDRSQLHPYCYLVYNYKRNKFYPFVPIAKQKIRSTEQEMQIMSAISDEVPFEKDMTVWYPLWDLPIRN